MLRVEPETLHALRKVSVAGGSSRSSIGVVREKHRGGLGHVVGRIVGKRVQRLLISRKCPAQYGLVNEIHTDLERMIPGGVSNVVAELILLLVAQRREQRDGRGELVVAIGLEAGNRQGCRTEREGKREAECGVARLREMQFAGIENERAQPRWAECVRITDDGIPVVVVRGQPSRGQRGLLYQVVMREVAVG